MAIIQLTYKVTLNIDDAEILNLTKFLELVKELKGTPELLKATNAKD